MLRPRPRKVAPPPIALVARRLRGAYPATRHHNKRSVFWEIAFIILSAQTAERAYLRSYRALRRSFRTREALALATVPSVERAIREGGLARKKAEQLIGSARALPQLLNGASWSGLSDEDVEAVLLRLPGIGEKSARCVAMYALDRDVFPVDVHVLRVLRRLGYTDATRATPHVANELQSKVPPQLRARLHVDLLSHGRAVCRSARPLCGQCPIADLCPVPANAHRAKRPHAARVGIKRVRVP